jgi:hypothetical protein
VSSGITFGLVALQSLHVLKEWSSIRTCFWLAISRLLFLGVMTVLGYLPTILHTTFVLLLPPWIIALRDVCIPGDDGVTTDEGGSENPSSADFVISCLWERFPKFVCHLPEISYGSLVVSYEEMDVSIRLTLLVGFHIWTPVDVSECDHCGLLSPFGELW